MQDELEAIFRSPIKTEYNEIDTIFDWLYLGECDTSEEFPIDFFRKRIGRNPQVIISILDSYDYLYPRFRTLDRIWSSYQTGITWYRYTARDTATTDMNSIWEQAGEVLSRCKEENKTTFVHCHAGISRSSSAVLYYLWKYENMSLLEAARYLRSKRPYCRPNNGFLKQLEVHS